MEALKEGRRITELRKKIAEVGADAFILFSSEYDNRPSVQYLSGFTGSAAVLVVGRDDARLIVDSRYFIQAREQSNLNIGEIQGRDPYPLIMQTLSEFKVKNLAIEEDKLAVTHYLKLGESGVKLVRTNRLLMRQRAVKDEDEIALMRRVARIAACAFESIVPLIHAGMTEAQVAALLAMAMRERGAQQLVRGHFVVASGPRGASPHGVFSDRIICDGDLITLDFGGILDGYVSDMSRTVAVGRVLGELRKAYDVVLEANKLALKSVSPGISGAEINAIACRYIEENGFGRYIAHAIGHGIGLELHEYPALNSQSDEPLKPGMVITIEPGIYIPGVGGVRIEDIVVVGDGGEVLTNDSIKEFRSFT